MEKKLKSSVGNVVTGERFWDREIDRRLFIERIEDGANILLVAQRRMGKTSLLKKIADELKERYYPIFVDLQAARNSPDAIRDLSVAIHEHKALGQKIKEVFANILSKIEKFEVFDFGVTLRAGLSASNWEQKGDEIFKALAQADKPVLLLLDEVPIMLSYVLKGETSKISSAGKSEVDKFMSWLRKNSLAHQANVRIVISGSIGLGPVLKEAGLSATINHLEPFELKPWSEDVAIGCIEALSNEYGVQLQDGVAKEMVNKIGCCIPHHVQMFFNHIYAYCVRKDNMVCSIKDVDEVYQTAMLGVPGHPELTHYEERLEMVLGKEMFTFAIDMLTETAVTGCLTNEAIRAFQKEYSPLIEGIDIVEVQKDILWVLEHDGYIQQSKNGYVFVSKLLQQWWKNHHGSIYTFIPVLNRGK
jgi:hypothetical protein